jgi:hypothetical protein
VILYILNVFYAIPKYKKGDFLRRKVLAHTNKHQKSLIEDSQITQSVEEPVEEQKVYINTKHKEEKAMAHEDKEEFGMDGFMEDDMGLSEQSNEEKEVHPDKKKKKKPDESSEGGLVQKLKDLPMWAKAGIGIVIVSLFMMKDEFKTGAIAPVLKDINTTVEALPDTQPVSDKTSSQLAIDKLNGCIVAAPISFSFRNGEIVPYFGNQDISGSAKFCDTYTVENYHMDASNGSLSVVTDVKSNGEFVKKLSLDPFAYFKPNYYLEGIGMKHPKTGAEIIYMPGDKILTSDGLALSLDAVKESADGATVVYSLTFNGTKTSVSVKRNLVQ